MLRAATLYALLSLALQGSADPPTSPVDPDESPVRAKSQAERVMNAGLPFAERMLAQHGEFPPFGAAMLPDGLIQTLGLDEGTDEQPIEEFYAQLADGLREGAQSGAYKAVATFAMVELRNPADGEVVTVVHVAPASVVYMTLP